MPLTHNTDYLGQARSRYPAQYIGKPRFDAVVQSMAAEAQQVEDAMWDVYTQRLLQNGPAQIVGRAVFNGEDTATLFWPFPFKDTNYLMLPGKPVILDGGGGVVVNVDNTTKTKTSITLIASALFTGYVDVLAWNVGENPIARGIGGDLLDKIGKIVGQPRNGMIDAQYLLLIQTRIAVNRSDGRRETLIRIAKLLVPGATIYVKDFPPCAIYIAPQAPITLDPYSAGGFMALAKSAGVMLMFVWTAVAIANTFTWGSIYAPGFSAGPPATNAGGTAAQAWGSVYNSGFSNGPPCVNAGGGFLGGVIQSQGET